MTINRLQIGLIDFRQKASLIKKLIRFKVPSKCHCNCWTTEIGPFYFNWLSDQCLPSKSEYGDKNILTDKDVT